MIAALLQLAQLFGGLSLLAFGGGSAILPDMQRAAVNTHHWLTSRQFLDLFTIARIMPGPGSLIVELIGEKVAGVPGALVAVVAMFTPPALIIYFITRAWLMGAGTGWRAPLTRALAPLAVGLTLASGIALMRGTEHSWLSYAITAIATAVLTLTRLNPVVVIAGGGGILLAISLLA